MHFFPVSPLKAAGRKNDSQVHRHNRAYPAVRNAILDIFAPPLPLRYPHCEMLITEHPKQKVPK